ncbi:MAG: carbohydrate kinase family protein [Candidatus Bathyarchaeia archaeon]
MVDVVVLGAVNWDINLFVKRFPEVGEEVPVEKITRVPGGKAANVAVAAARILGPGRASVIGCLGRDEIAENQIKILEKEGVITSGIEVLDGEESGQAYIIIDQNGRNVINTFFGANLKLSPELLRSRGILSLLREASIMTVIDPPIETIREAVFIGREEKKTVIWDAGVRSTLGITPLKEILKKIDYLVINEVEVKNLTGKNDPLAAWNILSEINSGITLVAKLGSRGCMMVDPEEAVQVRAVDLERLGLRVVNTVGCGDAFLGVFVASKAEGVSDKEALERANLAGALKATKPETRGSPLKDELKKYLKFVQRGEVVERF